MKRLLYWLTLAGIALTLWTMWAVRASAPAETAQGTLGADVRFSNVRDATFTVSWTTGNTVQGEVRYGTSASNLSQSAQDVRGSSARDDTHYVTIQGIQPNTRYFVDVISGGIVDDNGGNHYQVTTAPTLNTVPPSDTVYGQIFKRDVSTPARGALVYITLQDDDNGGSQGEAALLSSLVDNDGYWFTNLGNARTDDLQGYFSYSASGDQLVLEARGADDGQAVRTFDTADDSPADAITLLGTSSVGLGEVQVASAVPSAWWLIGGAALLALLGYLLRRPRHKGLEL